LETNEAGQIKSKEGDLKLIMTNEFEIRDKRIELSFKDAVDSLGGGLGSLAVEVYFATGEYTPSNLTPFEIEVEIAEKIYLAKKEREKSTCF